MIWIGHYFYFSLKEINEDSEPRIVNLKEESDKREAILSYYNDEEREKNELEQYVKTKLNDKTI